MVIDGPCRMCIFFIGSRESCPQRPMTVASYGGEREEECDGVARAVRCEPPGNTGRTKKAIPLEALFQWRGVAVDVYLQMETCKVEGKDVAMFVRRSCRS